MLLVKPVCLLSKYYLFFSSFEGSVQFSSIQFFLEVITGRIEPNFGQKGSLFRAKAAGRIKVQAKKRAKARYFRLGLAA